MKRREGEPRPELRDLPVPQHRHGFWDDVLDELAQVDVTATDAPKGPGDVVELAEPRPEPRRISPWLAASAAAAVVLVLGGATAVLTRPAADPDVVATPDIPATAGGNPETLSGSDVTEAPEAQEPAPWQATALPVSEAPAVLVDAWNLAENQRWCSALAPATLAALGSDATPRLADSNGGWAVAWDNPDGPGQDADGIDCADCGRSAFGVEGTGATHKPDTGQTRTADILWTDGSYAHLNRESRDESRTKMVANVVVAGQGCLYEVWSNQGEGHLRRLMDTLRHVDGLMSASVKLRTASDSPVVVSRGAPPWTATAVGTEAVDPLVLTHWNEHELVGPQLVFVDAGDGIEGATTRSWGSGVAWDNPTGPGHDNSNEPCAQCGRGVIGIGWQPASDNVADISLPYRIEWEDDSYAEYGGRLADPALPRDRVLYFDPETGEETVDALQAIVHVAGSELEVVVWSHLGEAHLLYLIDQLRWLDPAK